MRLKRVTAWSLALVLALSMDIPGVSAASDVIDTSLSTETSKEAQLKTVQEDKMLPGTNRTFFDEDSTIYDWFNISGFAADGVQDRSEYYYEWVANGCKNTDNYVVVEEDGYWKKGTTDYISEEEYGKLSTEEQANYRFVTAEEQFTTAFSTSPKVIQVNATELELGFHYLEDNNIPAGPIEQVTDYDSGSKKFAPVTNPIIMNATDKYGILPSDSDIRGTGVSDLSLYSHLTIFSTTGCTLRHVGLDLSEQEDIIIRNFKFEGMYEWDDRTEEMCGGADFTTRKRYGWCYVSGSHSNNIWVDHCTFGFAFDGNIDLANGSSFSITWCQFGVQDVSTNDETPVSITSVVNNEPVYSGVRWFESEGSELWKNILYMEEIYQQYKNGLIEKSDSYHFYTKYRDEGATPQEILGYAAMHSKVHLVGSGESSFYTNVDEKISLGFNYYHSINQRVPMIRQGNGHMYNCIVDDSEYVANSAALKAKGVEVGYTSGGCINARDGASIGADTCMFIDVRPINSGCEYQEGSAINATQWQNIFSYVRNNQLIVNSSVQNTGSEAYVGSSWDNNGNNAFMPSFTWTDYSSIGDFHWAKWANQDVFATWQSTLNRLDGNEQLLFKWAEKDWSAYAREYYIGSDELGYDYQCFDLDEMQDKVMTYGGAQEQLYPDLAGEDEATVEDILDYITPYSTKSSAAKDKVKIYVNTNGGEVSDETMQSNYYLLETGDTLTLPTSSQMSKDGYDFVGWVKGTIGSDETGEVLADPDKPVTVTVGTEDEIYYATWQLHTYTVSFNGMGGQTSFDSIGVVYGKTIARSGGLPTATKEGATLSGWYKYDPDTQTWGSKILANSTVSSDMVLYAKWSNTIKFNTDGGTAIADKKVDSGNKVSVQNPTKEGYTFVGWYTDPEFQQAFDIKTDVVQEPMTLYARFDKSTVKVSFVTGVDGVTVDDIYVEQGATGSAILAVEPQATDSAITFGGWYTDEACTIAFDPEAVIEEPLVLYAKWNPAVLLGDVDGDGSITSDDALAVLKKVVGTEPEKYIESAADVDGSGSITSDDALGILKKVVGSILDFSELQTK